MDGMPATPSTPAFFDFAAEAQSLDVTREMPMVPDNSEELMFPDDSVDLNYAFPPPGPGSCGAMFPTGTAPLVAPVYAVAAEADVHGISAAQLRLEPDEWRELLSARGISKPSAALSKARRKERSCVYASRQRTKRIQTLKNTSNSVERLTANLAKAKVEIATLKEENAQLRARLAGKK